MTRRGNGEGGAPTWSAATKRWKANYTAADGSRKTVYSSIPGKDGLADCRTKRDKALEVTRAGDLPKDGRVTLASWFDAWVATYILGAGRDARTVHDYLGVMRNHIGPVLGTKPLNGAGRVGPHDVMRMLNRMAAGGSSETHRQHVFDILRASLERARLNGITTDNAADSIDRPGRDTAEFVPWSFDEMVTFLESVEGDRLEAMWNIILLMGLRQGEVVGLKWANVDFDAGTLTVAGQLDRFTHEWKGRKGSHGRPSKVVLLELPTRVAELLRLRETAQKREQLRAGAKWTGNPQGLVFTTRYGTPMPHNNVGESWRVRVARVEGLRFAHFHGARHYFASMQHEGGATMEEIGELLGQKDKGATARRVYVHLNAPKASASAAARTNALPIPARKKAVAE